MSDLEKSFPNFEDLRDIYIDGFNAGIKLAKENLAKTIELEQDEREQNDALRQCIEKHGETYQKKYRNIDKIQKMDASELARFLATTDICEMCVNRGDDCSVNDLTECERCIKDWLLEVF